MTNVTKHEYLGDAVYIESSDRGVWLRTGDHRDEYCDNKIYLDCTVIDKLNAFIKRVKDE